MVDLEKLSDNIKVLADEIKAMKKAGIGQRLFEDWLMAELKITRKKAVQFIEMQEAFFNELATKYVDGKLRVD
mgnify:CR=1 FL=1